MTDKIVNIIGCLAFDENWKIIGTVDVSKLKGISNGSRK